MIFLKFILILIIQNLKENYLVMIKLTNIIIFKKTHLIFSENTVKVYLLEFLSIDMKDFVENILNIKIQLIF